jgi:hypothetical protein
MTKSEQGVQLTCERFQRGSTEKLHLEAIQSGIIVKQQQLRRFLGLHQIVAAISGVV